MTMTDERLAELDDMLGESLASPKALEEFATAAMFDCPDLRVMIDAQAATIARLEAERMFVLGAGECVASWGTYGGEPCVFIEPLVGAKGVQGEPVPDSEKHDPHLLRNGTVVLVLKGEPVAFLGMIAKARAALTGAA